MILKLMPCTYGILIFILMSPRFGAVIGLLPLSSLPCKPNSDSGLKGLDKFCPDAPRCSSGSTAAALEEHSKFHRQ